MYSTIESGESIAELVGRHAAEQPDAVAIEDGERQLTYAELNRAAGRIATALRSKGVENEEPVAVCLPRSWLAVCSCLGVLRAGAAYVPLGDNQPPERSRHMLERAGAIRALTDARSAAALPESVERLDAGALANSGDGTAPSTPPGGDRLAYVLFTSGSTGEPKGVEITDANLTHVLGRRTALLPKPEDVVLATAPIEFDLSAWEVWGALTVGARLVVAPPGRPDPQAVGRLIADRQVTYAFFAAGFFEQIVRVALPNLAGMRLVAAGGDVMPPDAAAALRSAHPSVRLLNAYGPTETSIVASFHEVREVDGMPLPIGRALPGYEFHILDADGAAAKPGEPGELWIGGPGVGRGYRGDPARTADRFRPDKGPEKQNARIYGTGDIVRQREDGELLFLGRADDQVKIAGHRVEPGEAEQALGAHPDVRHAVVVAREDVPGHKRLVGYAVPGSGATPTAEELESYLSERLPAFMIPKPIVLLDALPLNERGKVDRAALPTPTRRGTTADSSPIAALMAEVLGLDSVGPEENFFELGGTSLLAIQLVGRLRERLGVEVGIGAVFEAPTALALGERLATEGGESPALPPLVPGGAETTAPLSAAQRRAWLFGRMHPESIAYQTAMIFRFEGSLDVESLQGALGDLLERHEILRTSFVEREGEPVQAIRPHCEVHVDGVDLRDAGSDDWARLVRERVNSHIDPGEAPLVRWALARLGEESWALIQVEHHLVHDGWSFAILAGELAELYSARVEDRAAELPAPAAQFQDYARWERQAHRRPAVERQVERWVARLDPEPPLLDLPGARPRPGRESFTGGTVRHRLDRGLVERLRNLAIENRVTLFMVTLAAFLAQLHRYSGRADLQIGSGVANRRDPTAERLIGMVVNTVALRCNLGGDPSVSELLERVRAVALEAYADGDAPFDRVVKAIGPRRDPSRSPLIQALFSFHDAPRTTERWAGLQTRVVQAIPNGSAKADLNVIGIAEGEGELTFLWEHSDLLDDAGADRLAGHHLRLLEQFAERPQARLSELELTTAAEQRAIDAWNATPRSYDRRATIPSLVAAQARRCPEAIAVVDGTGGLAYRDLVERADAIAGSLKRHGAQPGDRVGVLLDRSAASVAAQLGILAAGAAYVPLDPLHPAARISRILADAGAGTVLTDESHRSHLPVGVAALDVAEAAAGDPAEAAATGPEDLAYLIYTSGSTGEPKGVEVTHRNVVRLVDRPDYAELGAGAVMLHAASPAFDAATLEIWGPLANGGTVACLGEQPDPDSIATAIERHGVTTLWLTAGLFHQVVDLRPDCLASVLQLLSGGDVLSPDHVQRALQALPPGARLTNGYGPTESTTFATTHDLRPGDPVDGPVPIGLPIQGTSCQVLDPAGHEAPIGVPGELAIGGDAVARGYRNDPELTAARFVPDPGRSGERRYLTGDRVRRRADGPLEFLGRVDRQVKVRGVRVEPAEVEEAMRAHSAVADIAVVPFERAPGDIALAAYVVAKPSAQDPPAEELRAHSLGRLPSAMVPTAWVTLPELPLTANGKLDRKRLPAPGREHLVRDPGGAPARGKLERRIVGCFEEVLGVAPVGAEDDFFALGGHSLLAVSLFAELERIRGGRRLPLATIFEAPTPRALATRLESGSASRWDNLVPLKPDGTRPPLFVVAAGDGNIVGFGPLARRLSAEQPLYALQPSGLDGRHPLDAGIDAMAARYLTALREVQPHGPYLLAGRCNGATAAYEMAQRLRMEGEHVALLASIDSGPPPAGPAELAPGIPYDPIMESAWLRARQAGTEALDPSRPKGPGQLATWLAAPVAPGVSRYLHEAWHWRDDLRRAWPDPLGVDAAAVAEWGWDHGPRELDLERSLLLPRPAREEPLPERLRRSRARGKRIARELATEAQRTALDLAERRLERPLPHARERLDRRVLAVAKRARRSYRAEPWPGRVLLITSPEFEAKPTYAAWELRALGGVDRRPLPVGHVEMLREPGAGLLARCLEDRIAEALAS